MSRSITLFINARKQSSRCKNKLLRPYSNTTLFEIALNKMSYIFVDEKFICANDEEFFSFDHSSDIKHFKRSLESVTIDGPLITVFESFFSFSSDYVMFLNPCHAMLKIETIQKAINKFKDLDVEAMTSVVKINDWIFDDSKKIVYPCQDLSHGDTKRTADAYRASHCFHIYNRKRFLETNGKLWTWDINDPFLFETDKQEAIDIDDDIDFDISESVYQKSAY